MDIVLQENDNLLRLLVKGIDDMECIRELSLDEAFNKISELRIARRQDYSYPDEDATPLGV